MVFLLLAVAVVGIARMNSRHLFNPDSPRYVMMARSLVEFRGYRMIDRPDQPLYTWRPPGVSLLLTPAALIAPFNAVAAKLEILSITLVMIWLTARLALRETGSGA